MQQITDENWYDCCFDMDFLRSGFHCLVVLLGHYSHQIQSSFEGLFLRGVVPGGLYFIEDLHCMYFSTYIKPNESTMTEIINKWLITLWKEAEPQKDKDIQWAKQISCSWGICVVQKISQQDITDRRYRFDLPEQK